VFGRLKRSGGLCDSPLEGILLAIPISPTPVVRGTDAAPYFHIFNPDSQLKSLTQN
jgi:hypothetical protein